MGLPAGDRRWRRVRHLIEVQGRRESKLYWRLDAVFVCGLGGRFNGSPLGAAWRTRLMLVGPRGMSLLDFARHCEPRRTTPLHGSKGAYKIPHRNWAFPLAIRSIHLVFRSAKISQLAVPRNGGFKEEPEQSSPRADLLAPIESCLVHEPFGRSGERILFRDCHIGPRDRVSC